LIRIKERLNAADKLRVIRIALPDEAANGIEFAGIQFQTGVGGIKPLAFNSFGSMK
jgi:hypothetical protein